MAEVIAVQASTSVVLDIMVSSSAWASVAFSLKDAIFVALFLVFSASLVSLPAVAMSFWSLDNRLVTFKVAQYKTAYLDMVLQSSFVASAAEITAQVDTRVAFDSIVES